MRNLWIEKKLKKDSANCLGGWKSTQSANIRRRNILGKTNKKLNLNNRRLQSAKILLSFAKISTNKKIKLLAKRDANYFLNLLIKS